MEEQQHHPMGGGSGNNTENQHKRDLNVDVDVLDSSLSSHMDHQESVHINMEAPPNDKEQDAKTAPTSKFNLLKKFKSKSFLIKKPKPEADNAANLTTNADSNAGPDANQDEANLEKKRGLFAQGGRSRSFPNLGQIMATKLNALKELRNHHEATEVPHPLSPEAGKVEFPDMINSPPPGASVPPNTSSSAWDFEPISFQSALTVSTASSGSKKLVFESPGLTPPKTAASEKPSDEPAVEQPKDLTELAEAAESAKGTIQNKFLEGKPEPPARTVGVTKGKAWVNSVTIFLYEAKHLPAMDTNGLSDPFCKFKLGAEKYKSRTVHKSLNPRWMEQFVLYIYESDSRKLNITVWDWDRGIKNDFIGKTTLDLDTLESEKLHDLWLEIDDDHGAPCGSVHLSVMISGKKLISAAGKTGKEGEVTKEEVDAALIDKYGLKNTMKCMGDVGTVTVKVFRGYGLRAADLNGKSDPYCVLQLVNARMQTQVELKTLDPEWNREFTFPVNDIHAVLDVTVYDMDQDKKSDFLGRIAVPLLKIHNRERRWYALKDQNLIGRTKGSILLEMDMLYNPVRAAVRTFKPREARLNQEETKFRRQVLLRNVHRMRSIAAPFGEMAQFARSCLQWESRSRSITAFFVYMLSVYFFELWMAPVALLGIFLKHYVKQQLVQTTYARDPHHDELMEYDDVVLEEDEDWMEEDPNKLPSVVNKMGSSNNIVHKVKLAQEQLRLVQNLLGFAADLCERMQNTVAFAVPWLSHLAVIILAVVAVVLYFVPLRAILLIYGVHKFTKKLRKPHSLGNNELLDFMSRVYTVEEVKQYREFRPREVPGFVPNRQVREAVEEDTPSSGETNGPAKLFHRASTKIRLNPPQRFD
ncbi:hypothetical protein RvY_10176-2 [Ramazzottius varieornatus]|uniref:C2 domain-containing protein n=1 Tax=Ramazzottius varieornatus TaxID=947166 RepID=A0A1D1VJN9_RAMVA|nr:hypothetical protein RvY_10176-2 [Ramazzottius varieornatus]